MEPDGLGVSRRRFEASARSAWHHHDHGQLLYVEEGRARTQKRGRAIREMGPGESDYTAPEVEHWHGATPEEPFVQVAVGFGSGITWLDKVTDEEYEGRQSRSASVAAGLAQPGFLHERGDGDLGARCGSRGSPFPIGRCQWI
jgi:mannose-6-phosphate isomerase-like protein (cupin superfamily)